MRQLSKSSAHISRRGDVMLRLIFPKETLWNEDSENAVLHDSNMLLSTIRRALLGQSLYCWTVPPAH